MTDELDSWKVYRLPPNRASCQEAMSVSRSSVHFCHGRGLTVKPTLKAPCRAHSHLFLLFSLNRFNRGELSNES